MASNSLGIQPVAVGWVNTAEMSEISQERLLLPIACTLDATTGPQRLGEWRVVLDNLVERERQPGSVVLRFRDRPGIGAELARLVAAEGLCCSFLDWALKETSDGWCVVISGDDAGLATLPDTL